MRGDALIIVSPNTRGRADPAGMKSTRNAAFPSEINYGL